MSSGGVGAGPVGPHYQQARQHDDAADERVDDGQRGDDAELLQRDQECEPEDGDAAGGGGGRAQEGTAGAENRPLDGRLGAGGIAILGLALLVPLQQFGVITALTIVYAFVGSVVVLPSLLVVWTDWTGADPAG